MIEKDIGLHMKFSVIITAYNIEEYITQAIESVLNQSEEAYEIIVLDDGSEDKTYDIAIGLLSKRLNTTIIKQNNQGPGGARNRGRLAARGDYVVFLDGDDCLKKNALEDFQKEVSDEPDAIFANRILFYEKDNKYKEDSVFTKSSQGKIEVGRQLLRRFAIHAKAFRRKFLIYNQIFFPLNMAWEDYPFAYKVLANAKKINVITDVVYIVRKRSGKNKSLTQQNRLTDFFLESRFKQIDLDREIIFNSKLPTVFKDFNFNKMEFESRLMKDIMYLSIEKDKHIRSNALIKFKEFIQKNEEVIFDNVSLDVKDIYKAILDENLSKAIVFIEYFKKARRA